MIELTKPWLEFPDDVVEQNRILRSANTALLERIKRLEETNKRLIALSNRQVEQMHVLRGTM